MSSWLGGVMVVALEIFLMKNKMWFTPKVGNKMANRITIKKRRNLEDYAVHSQGLQKKPIEVVYQLPEQIYLLLSECC